MAKFTWLPFRFGAPVTLGATGITRVDIPSIVESRLAREVQGYTTRRLIFNFGASATDGIVLGSVMLAVINLTNSSGLTSVTPEDEATADWQYWSEHFLDVSGANNMLHVSRDIEIKRISHGNDRNLYFVMENTGAPSIEINCTGRVLIEEK